MNKSQEERDGEDGVKVKTSFLPIATRLDTFDFGAGVFPWLNIG
jgi:hypothetical protein